MLKPVGKDKCSNCGKDRTIYENKTAYCEKCDKHFVLNDTIHITNSRKGRKKFHKECGAKSMNRVK